MERYLQIMKNILELSDTFNQGVQHIEAQLARYEGEATIPLLHDVITAFSSIETSLNLFVSKLPGNHIETYMNQIRASLGQIVAHYEHKEYDGALHDIRLQLWPLLVHWRGQLERAFNPLILI